MPNWADTHYIFYSKNKLVVEDFLDKLTKWVWQQKSLCPDAWYGNQCWLGNILVRAGFPKNEVYEDKYGRCRGEITDLDEGLKFNENEGVYYFYLGENTAWRAMPIMWRNIINKLYPDDELKFAYLCTEPGFVEADVYNKEMYFKLIGRECTSDELCYYIVIAPSGNTNGRYGPLWFRDFFVYDFDRVLTKSEFISFFEDTLIENVDLQECLKTQKGCTELSKEITKQAQVYDKSAILTIVIIREVDKDLKDEE